MFAWLLPVVFALDPLKVKYAVNCGGPQITTNDGVTYIEDTGYSGGVVSEHGKSATIKLTKTPELYQTERYASSDLTYTIPISESGDYVLVLKFSEVWFNSEQQKIFNVNIGDLTVVEHLDIFAKVGINSAYDEFIPLSYKDGRVKIKGEEAKNAVKNGRLRVTFKKLDYDNPKINAIVLVKGDISDTNYSQQKKFTEERAKAAKQEEKRYDSVKNVKVHDNEDDFEDFEDLSHSENSIEFEQNQSIWGILGSVPALIVICLVLVLSIAACMPSAKPQLQQVQKKKT